MEKIEQNRNKDDGDAQALTNATFSLHSQPSLILEPSTFSSLMRGRVRGENCQRGEKRAQRGPDQKLARDACLKKSQMVI